MTSQDWNKHILMAWTGSWGEPRAAKAKCRCCCQSNKTVVLGPGPGTAQLELIQGQAQKQHTYRPDRDKQARGLSESCSHLGMS